MMNKAKTIWLIIFTLIFLLSQDYLFTSWEKGTSFLGFPSWMGWFMTVHAVFIAAFAYFAFKFWKAE